MKTSGILRLERLVRETVEGSFGRLFGGYLEPIDVATRLVQAMEESASHHDTTVAYEVSLHPIDYRLLLEENPDLADDLADSVWELGQRYDIELLSKPTIALTEDATRRRHSVRVKRLNEDSSSSPGLDTTQVARRHGVGEKALADLRALDAFLIVQGKRHVDLDKPLITIGRRPDNDIVLESAEVSRKHAQIRWRFDRFILYDVSGRGRTSVNGEAVRERILMAGDVISLSGSMLVYGEGSDRDDMKRSESDEDEGSTLVFRPKRS